jgi:pSer/pThr/pTyr-binding forkhead associated (FHA) protein
MDVNLILFKMNGSQKAFPLSSSVTVIGRRKDCDLRIPLMAVSKRHCQLILDDETLKIRDLGSRNGTYLNDKRIEEATARAGDNIKIGPLIFALQINGQPKEFVPPAKPTKKPPPQEKPKTKATEQEPSGSFAELTEVSEESDIFSDLDTDKEGGSFLDELEDI